MRRHPFADLQQRHYEGIAKIIASLEPNLRGVVSLAFIPQLKAGNQKFDREIFIRACNANLRDMP